MEKIHYMTAIENKGGKKKQKISSDIKTKSADVILKTPTILKEMSVKNHKGIAIFQKKWILKRIKHVEEEDTVTVVRQKVCITIQYYSTYLHYVAHVQAGVIFGFKTW